jgi:prepilin-type processing-associated H-X9-DG protein
MNLTTSLTTFGLFLTLAPAGFAASAGPTFYGDPPDEHHPWAVHDGNRPQPKIVTPGTFSSPEQPGKPPSDAVVLFDGTDLSKWQTDRGAAPEWLVKDSYMQVAPGKGSIRTRETFGDCQLHIEFATPSKVEGSSQGRGNSGVFLMGMLELQVLDSYNNITYADGHVGAYYGINPPLANVARPPGEWQAYDIVFRRPIYRDGQPIDPGYVTAFLNGILVQDHTTLEGPGTHMARTKPGPFPAKGPLSLQDHGNTTRFRNIWYRELPARASEGGTDGYLSTEAALAKRKQIAADIREDAAKLANPAKPMPEMLRWFESLVYEKDAAAMEKAQQMAMQYIESVKQLPADKIAAKRDEVRGFNDNLRYLIRFKILPADFAPKAELDKLIRDQGWDKRK